MSAGAISWNIMDPWYPTSFAIKEHWIYDSPKDESYEEWYILKLCIFFFTGHEYKVEFLIGSVWGWTWGKEYPLCTVDVKRPALENY